MMQEEKKVHCPACGGYNHGIQTHCLMCKAELPSQVEAAPVPVSSASTNCTHCGAVLAPEQKFCTTCGTKR
jgi:uncharacterized OB-fold protein